MRKLLLALIAMTSALALAACGGGDKDPAGEVPTGGSGGETGDGGSGGDGEGGSQENCTVPKVDAIDPSTARIGETVFLQGSCLKGIPGKPPVITFHSNKTTPLRSVSDDGTAMEVQVPPGAINGKVKVAVDHGRGYVTVEGPEFTVSQDLGKPIISGLIPSVVNRGTPGIAKLSITGSEFSAKSEVYLDDLRLDAAYRSWSNMEAVVPAEALAEVGELQLRVHNPPPGGGDSVRTLKVVEPVNVVRVVPVSSHEIHVEFDQPLQRADLSGFRVRLGADNSLTLSKNSKASVAGNRAVIQLGNGTRPNNVYTLTARTDAVVAQGGGTLEETWFGDFRSAGSDPILIDSYGGNACGMDGLNRPSGITAAFGRIYVTEHLGHQVQALRSTGELIGYFGADAERAGDLAFHTDPDEEAWMCGAEPASWPNNFSLLRGAMAVDPATGIRYIADTGGGKMVRFDADDQLIGNMSIHDGANPFSLPVALGIVDNSLFVAGSDDRIRRFNLGAGGGFSEFGDGPGTGPRRFHFHIAGGGVPAMAVDENHYYIVDSGNHRVVRIKRSDEAANGWIGFGHVRYDFESVPCLDSATPETGAPGCRTTDGNGLASPNGVAVDPDGNLWVTDQAGGIGIGGRLMQYDSLGRRRVTMGLDYIPAGVAIDDAGFLWVADRTNDMVHKYER